MPYKDAIKARDYKRAYYKNRGLIDPDYYRKGQHTWRDKNPKKYILSRARGRAKIEGLPFEIEETDFEIPEYCPVFPELRLAFSVGRGTRPDNIPTLDKIIPSLGYVPGNVAIISMRANRLKSDASLLELERIVAWVKKETQG